MKVSQRYFDVFVDLEGGWIYQLSFACYVRVGNKVQIKNVGDVKQPYPT
jgi:hypothetical protein